MRGLLLNEHAGQFLAMKRQGFLISKSRTNLLSNSLDYKLDRISPYPSLFHNRAHDLICRRIKSTEGISASV